MVINLIPSYGRTNYTGINDKHIDELIEKGRQLLDGEERAAVYAEL